MKNIRDKKIGIVLSGGGARGIAHIGAFRALELFGIYPSIISGASAGSIAGAFYASGFNAHEMLQMIKSTPVVRSLAARPGLGWKGLLGSGALRKLMNKFLKDKDFSDLKRELHICVTNMNEGVSEYFSTGNLVDAITASCSVPVLMTPCKIGETTYSDGGILNNFPIDPLEGKCDLILGISVNPIQPKAKFGSIKQIAERSFLLSLRENERTRKERCDWLVEPEGLYRYGILDSRKADEIYRVGYEATLEMLKEIHPWDVLRRKSGLSKLS